MLQCTSVSSCRGGGVNHKWNRKGEYYCGCRWFHTSLLTWLPAIHASCAKLQQKEALVGQLTCWGHDVREGATTMVSCGNLYMGLFSIYGCINWILKRVGGHHTSLGWHQTTTQKCQKKKTQLFFATCWYGYLSVAPNHDNPPTYHTMLYILCTHGMTRLAFGFTPSCTHSPGPTPRCILVCCVSAVGGQAGGS